jgi:hypothetical protein
MENLDKVEIRIFYFKEILEQMGRFCLEKKSEEIS